MGQRTHEPVHIHSSTIPNGPEAELTQVSLNGWRNTIDDSTLQVWWEGSSLEKSLRKNSSLSDSMEKTRVFSYLVRWSPLVPRPLSSAWHPCPSHAGPSLSPCPWGQLCLPGSGPRGSHHGKVVGAARFPYPRLLPPPGNSLGLG